MKMPTPTTTMTPATLTNCSPFCFLRLSSCRRQSRRHPFSLPWACRRRYALALGTRSREIDEDFFPSVALKATREPSKRPSGDRARERARARESEGKIGRGGAAKIFAKTGGAKKREKREHKICVRSPRMRRYSLKRDTRKVALLRDVEVARKEGGDLEGTPV